jgi:hypothetical protein
LSELAGSTELHRTNRSYNPVVNFLANHSVTGVKQCVQLNVSGVFAYTDGNAGNVDAVAGIILPCKVTTPLALLWCRHDSGAILPS